MTPSGFACPFDLVSSFCLLPYLLVHANQTKLPFLIFIFILFWVELLFASFEN